MGNTPKTSKVSPDWLNFNMQPDGRMPRIVKPPGSVTGTEQIGGVTLNRIDGAVDEATLDALLENLEMLGVDLPPET